MEHLTFAQVKGMIVKGWNGKGVPPSTEMRVDLRKQGVERLGGTVEHPGWNTRKPLRCTKSQVFHP